MYARESGVLMHISSLPGPYGIGTLGAQARQFVDFLKRAGQRYWQILPLVPTGFGDSPYQSSSSWAGNPYFIDPDTLSGMGLLGEEDLRRARLTDNPDSVCYEELYKTRLPLLRRAYENGKKTLAVKIDAFTEANSDWLPDYALFMALKTHFNMLPLSKWPNPAIKARERDAMESYGQLLKDDIEFNKFLQYIFFMQWMALKEYANRNGVHIIGDIPIYVSEDSAEVWACPELFKLDKDLTPTLRAGVPPDSFSPTGQLWGNPVYNWAYHEKTNYEWWIRRVTHIGNYYDVVRIDHFRGFESFWEIPKKAKTAETGKWRKGPAMKLLNAIGKALPDIKIIAEDLGDLTEEVRAFVTKTGLPGMRVLADAFDDGADSAFLPHNCPENAVIYTSTHDSPTFLEWFTEKADAGQREFAIAYLRLSNAEGICWGAIKTAWMTPCRIAITPAQDILGLSSDARMNRPSTLGGSNWRWRVRGEAINDTVADILYNITRTYRRAAAWDTNAP